MFTHDCTACGKRQLIFMSQMTSVDAADGAGQDLVVHFTCWCGAPQSWTPSAEGRRRLDLVA